jgi:hypothetical protein
VDVDSGARIHAGACVRSGRSRRSDAWHSSRPAEAGYDACCWAVALVRCRARRRGSGRLLRRHRTRRLGRRPTDQCDRAHWPGGVLQIGRMRARAALADGRHCQAASKHPADIPASPLGPGGARARQTRPGAPANRPQREPASGSSGLSLSDRNARALFTRLARHRSVCSGIRREQTARRARYRSRRKPRVTTPRAGSRLVLTGLSASRPALKIVGEVAVFATVRGCSHARALAPMRAGGAQRTTGTSSVERFGGSGAWCCSRIAVDGTKVDANVLPRERPRHLRRSRVR